MKSLVLLSGGIDSATALAMSLVEHSADPSCLFIDYGQSAAAAEGRSSRLLADHFGVPHRTVKCQGFEFGAGEIRGRNAFLLHTALMLFDADTGHVTLAIHAGTPYRDCEPGFITAMQGSFDYHTDGRIDISVPFISNTKPEVFALAQELEVPVTLTHSCEASDTPCLSCLSCRDREMLLAAS